MEIGAITAKITADISGYNAGIDKAKAKTQELGDSGKRAASDVGSIGSAGEKIGQLTAVLDNTNAKIEQQRRKIGELRNAYDLTFNPATKSKLQEQIVNTEATLLRLQQTSDKTAQKIWDLEDALNDASNGAEKSQRSFDGLGTALTAIGANIALDKTTDLMQALVQESENLTQSLTGLQSVAKSFGHDVDATTESAKRLEKTGLIPLSSAAAALKNLLGAGLSLDQANELMDTFLDRAAFGKSATISMGQAVENLAQAFKTESSTLGDLSGISENYSLILEKGAAQLGKTVAQLSEAERAQAKYLGILQVSQPYLGDHIKLMESYGGKQAQMNAKWTELRATLGDQLLPIFDELITKITPIIEDTIKWVEENGELVAGIAAGTASFLAMVAAITTVTAVVNVLRTAFIGLNAALGPIGLITAAIAILVPTVISANSAMGLLKDSAEESGTKIAELAREYDDIKKSIDDFEEGSDDAKAANERLKTVMEQIREISPDLVKGYDNEATSVRSLTSEIEDNTAARIENLKAMIAAEKAKLPEKKDPWLDLGWFKMGAEDMRVSTARMFVEKLEKELATLEAAQKTFNIYRKENHWNSMQDYWAAKYPDAAKNIYKIPSEDGDTGNDDDSKGKSKTAAEIAAEFYRAEMKVLDYRRNIDQLTEEQEKEALESMLNRYGQYADLRMDLEVKIHRLSRQMTEESARDSFEFSSKWIANEEERMRASNASEQEIAQMKIEAWTRVRNRYAEDTEYYKRADKEIYDNKRQLIDKITTMQIASLQKERDMKRDALRDTQKAEQDAYRKSIDEQKEAFDTYIQSVKDRIDSVRARYDAITESLRNQISAIDEEIRKQAELDRIEDRRMKRAELAEKRAKIIADKRYEKIIVGADGKLTTELTHDTEAVAEIDRQLAEMDREDAADAKRKQLEERKRQLQDEITAVNAKRDAEISALNDEIEAVQRAKEIKINAMNEELEAMRENHAEKLAAFDTYWASVLDKDKVAQDMRNKVLQDGLDSSLARITDHLNNVMSAYESSISALMAMGSELNASLPMGGPVTNNTATTNDNSTKVGNVYVSGVGTNSMDDIIAAARRAAGRG